MPHFEFFLHIYRRLCTTYIVVFYCILLVLRLLCNSVTKIELHLLSVSSVYHMHLIGLELLYSTRCRIVMILFIDCNAYRILHKMYQLVFIDSTKEWFE